MLKRFLAIFTILIFVLCLFNFSGVTIARAEDPLLSSDTGWVPAYPNNNQNDYLQDQQTGSGSVSQDIVGDSSYPSTYIRFSSTELAFRVRLSNIDGTSPYAFKNFAFVGIDADCSGNVDFFMGAYNPTGNNGRVGIYSAATGYANLSPSTTGISGKPLLAFMPQDDVNYSLALASDGSNFNGDTDYFMSFKFSVDDITLALAGTGYTFNSSTPFRFMTGTAAQDNSFNQDLNGMDENGWSTQKTWNELGVFSNIVTASGSVTYYTVTFDKNTGDTEATPQTKAVQANSDLDSLPTNNPTKRGMYFQEWNTQPDGTGSKVTPSTVITGNTTFYAIWSNIAVLTVTFDPNGGNFGGSTSSVTVPTINGVVDGNIPTDPTKTNRYFMGWLISGTSEFFNSATPVNSNMTVIAQWANTANKVAVFYDNYDTSTGGSEIARIFSNGNSNNFNGTLPIITRSGYTFGGWFLDDKTCSSTAVSDISSQGNYYAKWTLATYTVTFDQNYIGSPANTTKPISGGLLGTMPLDPTRTNYQFIEWNRVSDGTGEAMYPSSVIASDTTVYAIWEPIQTVTFYANGGEYFDSSTQWATSAVDGVLSLLPQPPSRENYTFLGWGTTNSSTSTVSLVNVTGHNAYYAVWAPVKTVTFNENFGAPPATDTVLTAYGSVLYIPPDPTRSNYSFVEWNLLQTGSGSEFTLSTEVADDMIVYAQWLPEWTPHTVTFVTNGGSSVDSMTVAEIINEPVTVKEGYTLKGWYTDEGLSNKADFPFAVLTDTTLYADWTPHVYTIEYNSNGGDGGGISSSSHTYDVSKALTTNGFTKQYYTFAGWAQTTDGAVDYSNGESVVNLTNVNDATVNLYAKWTPNTYTVVYNGNSGTGSTASSSHTCGTPKALTLNGFALQNYTFAGWSLTEDGNVDYTDGETVIDLTDVNGGTVNLYAIWTLEETPTYNVSFVTNGGSSIPDQTADQITNSPVSTKNGYTLKDWYSDEGLNNKVDFPFNVTEDTILYAEWTPNTYTVAYNSNGGTGSTDSSSHTYDISKALTANDFERQYYHFAGWTETVDGDVLFVDSETVLNLTDIDGGTVNLYAKWVANSYTVNYDSNGGTGTTDQSIHTCDVPKVLTTNAFTRQYYSFIGWALVPTGSNEYLDGETVVNLTDVDEGSVTLYAKWLAEPELESSDADGTIFKDGRITLTPNITGGTWDYDHDYLSFDGTRFTALKTGTTIVTYIVDGVSVQYTIIIELNDLPSTGQDFTIVYILLGLSLGLLTLALIFMRKKSADIVI